MKTRTVTISCWRSCRRAASWPMPQAWGKIAPVRLSATRRPFPPYGIAWDFNYRGELDFLRQARSQAGERNLHVEDGWDYFVRGWAQVITYVLNIRIEQDTLQRLAAQAAEMR